MTEDTILEKLDNIEKMLTEQNLLKKEVLDFNEACQYLGISKSHLYKLTSKKEIPHYCPNNKKLYFKRSELDDWLLRNRQTSREEINQRAEDYIIHHKLK